jgi:acetyl esterase/lipase
LDRPILEAARPACLGYANTELNTVTNISGVDYRLAPEHKFPSALIDVISSYFYLIDRGIHPNNVTIIGDSAGGGLAIALTLWLRDNSFKLPGKIIAISPWLDLTHSFPSFTTNAGYDWLPESITDPTYIKPGRSHLYVSDDTLLGHPYVSPVFADIHPDKSLQNVYIQVGELERLRDECIEFARLHEGVDLDIVKDGIHVLSMDEQKIRDWYLQKG